MHLFTQLPEKTCPLGVLFFKHAWVHLTLQKRTCQALRQILDDEIVANRVSYKFVA